MSSAGKSENVKEGTLSTTILQEIKNPASNGWHLVNTALLHL